MKPKISVLIVSYNVKNYLLQAIDSVKKSKYGGLIEFIIVDNNSFDGTSLSLKNLHPEIPYIQNQQNIGFGKGINQAAKKSRGEFLFILNPDTIIQEDTIDKLVHYLVENPQVGMVGPKVLNADGSLQLACKRSIPSISVSLPKMLGLSKLFPNNKWAGRYNLTYLDENQTHSVDAISGSAMMIRKSIFDQLNGFDESFFMYGEDLDLCKRIIQSGYEIHFTPITQIIHYGGESVRSARFDSINAFFNSMTLFYKKHFSMSTSIILSMFIKGGIWIKKISAFLKEWKSQIISIFLDGLIILGSYGFIINFGVQNKLLPSYEYGFLSFGIFSIWIFSGYLFFLYGKNILSYYHGCYAGVTGFLIISAFNGIFSPFDDVGHRIIFGSIMIMFFMPGWRLLVHFYYLRFYGKRIGEKHNLLFTHKTLVLGLPSQADSVVKKLRQKIDSGIDIMGICSKKLFSKERNYSAPILGPVNRINEIIKSYRIKELIFLSKSFSNHEIMSLIEQTRHLKVSYRIVPRETDILIGKASIDHFGDLSLVSVDIAYHKNLNRILKRSFDIVFAFLSLVGLTPIFLWMLFTGKSIKKESFWTSEQSKFTGYIFTSTHLKYSLLLISILKGQMSFVGNELVPCNEPNPNLKGKPGFTGITQLKNIKPEDESFRQAEYYYLQNQGLLLDIELIIMSIFTGRK